MNKEKLINRIHKILDDLGQEVAKDGKYTFGHCWASQTEAYKVIENFCKYNDIEDSE